MYDIFFTYHYIRYPAVCFLYLKICFEDLFINFILSSSGLNSIDQRSYNLFHHPYKWAWLWFPNFHCHRHYFMSILEHVFFCSRFFEVPLLDKKLAVNFTFIINLFFCQ